MHFELPGEAHKDLEPLRVDAIDAGIPWEISQTDIKQIVEGDPNLEEMADELFDQCLAYTRTVIDEMNERSKIKEDGVTSEEYRSKDATRTITHNATVSTIQGFCRAVVKAGKGEEMQKLIKNPRSRAECAFFATRLTLSRISDIAV